MIKKFLIPIFVLAFFMVSFLFCQVNNSYAVKVTSNLDEAFKTGKIVVKGEGVAPHNAKGGKARLMALRAAKADAYRLLLELVRGVSLTGEKTISDQIDIVTTVEGIVMGAVEVSSGFDDGLAEVYLELQVTGEGSLAALLLPQLVTDFASGEKGNKFSGDPGSKNKETLNYDGLIVDVRGTSFKPALLNNILVRGGDVLYDPSVVSPSVLALRGAAEYTVTVGKARAALEERGSKNPIVVKAESIVNDSDVVVSIDDAGFIFSANENMNFLESAKVVFVLD